MNTPADTAHQNLSKRVLAESLPESTSFLSRRSLSSISWLSFSFVALIQVSEAGFPIHEPFSYAAGSNLAQQNLGSGWNGPWSTLTGNGKITASTGSIGYPGVAGQGNKMSSDGLNGSGTNTFLYRDFSQPLIDGNTYYISFLAQNINEGRQYFGLSLYSDDDEQMLIGQSSYSPNWTVNRLAGLDTSVGVLVSKVDSSKPAMLLVKLEMRPGAEQVTFWVNPDLSKAESGSIPQGGTSYSTKGDMGSLVGARIGGGGYRDGVNPSDHFLDEIRIDTKSPFADTRDFDGDGLNNYQEIYIYKTNPLVFNNWITSKLELLSIKTGKGMQYRIASNIKAKKYGATGLPTGLHINALTGVISGKPTKKGIFKVTLTATRDAKTSAKAVLRIKVS